MHVMQSETVILPLMFASETKYKIEKINICVAWDTRLPVEYMKLLGTVWIYVYATPSAYYELRNPSK